MTLINSFKDPKNLTLTFVSEFEADVERVWQVWADPRKLERWWGPPTYPAEFTRHELRTGGEMRYAMTGPEGDKARGWWQILAVEAPTTLTYRDGFAGDDGEPNGFLGHTDTKVTLEDIGVGRTRMTSTTSFDSLEQLDEMVKMGMEEGAGQALGQVDAVLAEG